MIDRYIERLTILMTLFSVCVKSLDRKMCAILPIFRVTTQAHPTIGTHTATLDGIYEITFDNSYSR